MKDENMKLPVVEILSLEYFVDYRVESAAKRLRLKLGFLQTQLRVPAN